MNRSLIWQLILLYNYFAGGVSVWIVVYLLLHHVFCHLHDKGKVCTQVSI
jgi:hypothetical protein